MRYHKTFQTLRVTYTIERCERESLRNDRLIIASYLFYLPGERARDMTEGALISRALTHPSAVQICTQVILTEQYTRTWVSVKSASVGIIVWVLCVNVQHSFPWNMVYCVMVFETQGRGSYKSKFHFNVLTKDQIKHFN